MDTSNNNADLGDLHFVNTDADLDALFAAFGIDTDDSDDE
jgi:hypothetical protein